MILFDNAGVGASSGETPASFPDMATDAIAFIKALGIGKADILGYSIGGKVAQEIAVQAPDLVRKLILVGTGPRGADTAASKSAEIFSATYDPPEHLWIAAHFLPNRSRPRGRIEVSRTQAPPPGSQPGSQRGLRRRPVRGDRQVEREDRWRVGLSGRHSSSGARGRWQQRPDHSHDQRIHAATAPAERAAHHLSGFQPRAVLPVSGAVPGPRRPVPGCVTRREFVEPVGRACSGPQRRKNDMSQKLEGKTALVTGGSRGIGAAIAKRLAADGAKVAITYTKGADAAAAVVKAIESAGGKAIAIQADAMNPKAVQAAVEKTVNAFGKLDVLVNNAGTAIPKKFEETTLEELDQVINLNIRGVFVTTQAALKQMNDGGRIISIGSCVGERMMTPGLVPYSATKSAIRMFTQGLSREVGDRGITVNNVQPGPIDTDLNPASGDWATPQKAVTALNRYGKAEEVAALVAFVASPEASYITGANLTVDGGTNA